MGIIGVVAALTIPNLNSSTGEKEKVTKLMKLQQNLDDAVGRAKAVYGPIEEWCLDMSSIKSDECQDKTIERIAEFLKVSKKSTTRINDTGTYHYTLADGSEIIFYDNKGQEYCNSYPNQTLNALIEVDIDGSNKGKNLYGYDRFGFVVTDQGVLPDNTGDDNGSNNPVAKIGNQFYSTAWVILMGNMDYLKTTDGKTCPNKKILDWTTNTSCK